MPRDHSNASLENRNRFEIEQTIFGAGGAEQQCPKCLISAGDFHSGKELIYKPTEKGYLFYSVGPNGKDDGGRWYDDDPPGDDIRVKMPLPELKKN